MEPEYYQYLMLMFLAVARSRPENLLLLAAQVGDELVGEMTRGPSERELEKREFDLKDNDIKVRGVFV